MDSSKYLSQMFDNAKISEIPYSNSDKKKNDNILIVDLKKKKKKFQIFALDIVIHRKIMGVMEYTVRIVRMEKQQKVVVQAI